MKRLFSLHRSLKLLGQLSSAERCAHSGCMLRRGRALEVTGAIGKPSCIYNAEPQTPQCVMEVVSATIMREAGETSFERRWT